MNPENTQENVVVFNMLTKREELFIPREKGVVKFFTCGPSVYRKQHIGNYRTFLFEDIVQRYLEYLGFNVLRSINFTDIEDKTITQADEENKTVHEVTKPIIDNFISTAGKLGIHLPDSIPRATTSVDEATALIKALLDKGIAYRHRGNVYFDPLKYDKFGEIFGLDMSKWPKKKIRFSKDTYSGQRWNLGDFILWHGHKDGQPVYWDTEIGRGRPSWNIQDPAMIMKTLGPEIDIHAGGIDNIYRHHDYNRAVVEAATGKETAHYWMHCKHLIVEGEKMSKSKGNTLYFEDIIEKGYDAKHVRFLLMYCHYREELDITDGYLQESCNTLDEIHHLISSIKDQTGPSAPDHPYIEKLIAEVPRLFKAKMNDNLRVTEAVDSIVSMLKSFSTIQKSSTVNKKQVDEFIRALEDIDTVLGVLF